MLTPSHRLKTIVAALAGVAISVVPAFAQTPKTAPAWVDQVQVLTFGTGYGSASWLSGNYTGEGWGPTVSSTYWSPGYGNLNSLFWHKRGDKMIFGLSMGTLIDGPVPAPDDERMVDIYGKYINGGNSGAEYNQYSIFGPAWQQFLLAMMEKAADLGGDGIQLDDMGGQIGQIYAYQEQQGSFDQYTMAAFRNYLIEQYGAAGVTSQFGIASPQTFDFGQWIIQNGLQATWYQQPFAGLTREFYIFMNVEYHQIALGLANTARQYALTTYNREFTISGNVAFSNEGISFADVVDYFANEVLYGPSVQTWANSSLRSYRSALDHSAAVLNEVTLPSFPSQAPNFLRVLLGDIYANRGLALLGTAISIGVGNPIAYDPGDLARYSQFVQSNRPQLEQTSPIADIGLLYSVASNMQEVLAQTLVYHLVGNSEYYGMGKLLVDNNLQFEAVFAPSDTLSSATGPTLGDLQQYRIIILPNTLLLSDSQVTTLLSYVSSGGIIFATGGVGAMNSKGDAASRPALEQLQATEGAHQYGAGWFVYTQTLLGNNYAFPGGSSKSTWANQFLSLIQPYLSETPLIVEGGTATVGQYPLAGFLYKNPAGSRIVHLVNYDYELATDTLAAKTNLRVSARLDGIALNSCVLISPDADAPVSLPVTINGDYVSVIVPQVGAYSLLSFQTASPVLAIGQVVAPAGPVTVSGDQLTFSISLNGTGSTTPVYQWYLDGSPVRAQMGAQFSLDTTSLSPGLHTVSVTVTDGTTTLRRDFPIYIWPAKMPAVAFDEAHGERISIDLATATSLSPAHPDWASYAMLATSLQPGFNISRLTSGTLNGQVLQGVDALVLPAPWGSFTTAEIDAVSSYVSAGGSLLFLGNEGLSFVNPLLAVFGMSLNPSEVWDQDLYDSGFSRVFPVWLLSPNPAVGMSPYIVVNTAGSFDAPSSGVQVLASTTPGSWRNTDGQSQLDAGETKGPFPFIVATSSGSGRVVAIASSYFEDSALSGGDPTTNLSLFTTALQWLTDQRKRALSIGTMYTLTTSVSPTSAGSVSANPTWASGTFPSGLPVCLTATASAGWTFSSWGGGSVDSSGCLIVMGNLSVTANFIKSTVGITSVNVAGGGADIAPNAWIEIKGSGLAPPDVGSSGITWGSAPEFASGKMPTQLDGVSVTVNGKPAYVYYVSATQLNVLTPLDTATGTVMVQVTNGPNTSTPFPVTMKSAAPAFLLFGATTYIVAIHADGSLLGPASMSVPGYTFTPAKPNETIVLYGAGFGLPAGTLTEGSSSQSSALATPPAIRIGENSAAVTFAGLVSPGLYQFNVVVPSGIVSGDNAVTATYPGASPLPTALIAVQLP